MGGAALLVTLKPASLPAEDRIQAFVNSNGRVVFTNMVDNTPAPVAPILPETTDLLVEEMPASLGALVNTIAANHGVDPALVRAVIKTESNFNRWAVSPKGARGLMQLIPETGRRYGVQDFFDPQQNIEGGVRYLKFLLEKFNGNIDLALAGYNAGENLVGRLGRIPPIPETTNYVRKIRAVYKRKSAPATAPAPMIATAMAAPAMTAPAVAAPAVTVSAPAAPREAPSRIFRVVDERGVVHFSNIEPPSVK